MCYGPSIMLQAVCFFVFTGADNGLLIECKHIYNVFTDFFCASLPAFVIRDLQMSTRTKYALSSLMGLGIL